MKLSRRLALNPVLPTAGLVATLLLFSAFPGQAEEPAAPAAAAQVDSQPASVCEPSRLIPRTFPSIAGSIPPSCASTGWASSTPSFSACVPGPAPALSHMLEEAGAH